MKIEAVRVNGKVIGHIAISKCRKCHKRLETYIEPAHDCPKEE